jgi:hypothetical protein
MPCTPQAIDPYALFNEITADPYLNNSSLLPPPSPPQAAELREAAFAPAAKANHEISWEPTFSRPIRARAQVPSPTAPQKRYPRYSSPTTNHTSVLSTLRCHLVAILRARVPLANDDIANPVLSEAFAGPLTRRVWQLVWELVDAEEEGKKGRGEMERLKRRLVSEVVGCVVWDRDMDGACEARRLVEDLWPAAGSRQ